jgi:hypothetical protein
LSGCFESSVQVDPHLGHTGFEKTLLGHLSERSNCHSIPQQNHSLMWNFHRPFGWVQMRVFLVTA